MGSFSIWHWLIVLVLVMLIFGTKKLRNVGADLGGAIKGFKDSMQETVNRTDATIGAGDAVGKQTNVPHGNKPETS